jgi:hypothetical protein
MRSVFRCWEAGLGNETAGCPCDQELKMSRTNFPQTDVDRIAVAVTMAAVAAVVWVIVAFSPNPRDVSVAAVHTIATRQNDEGSRAAARDTVSPASNVSAQSPVKSVGVI